MQILEVTQIQTATYNGKDYTSRHGDAFDRGGCDYYYGRPRQPHYYIGKTRQSPIVEEKDMTPQEIADYHAGYSHAQEIGEQKDWG